MSRSELKKKLKMLLSSDNWEEAMPVILGEGQGAAGPLFSFLLLEPEIMHRAARALGLLIASLYEKNPEIARNYIRRFMWHMNEESGNIGWGIPAAFAETLVASPDLARTYSRILDSYIMDLGFDDNYCDHDILRRTCYWAIGRLAEKSPELAEPARSWLVKGLKDSDLICRGMAAWALGKLKPEFDSIPSLRKLAENGLDIECAIFEDKRMKARSASELALEAINRITTN